MNYGFCAVRRPFSWVLAACCCLCIAIPAAVTHAQTADELLKSAIDEQSRIGAQSQRSQRMIAQLDEEASEYFAEYRVALQQVERLRIYNANLEKLIADQNRERTSISSQLEGFGDLEQGIVPLMYDMIAALKDFVRMDVPFSKLERQQRIDRLESNIERSDLTVSEKYRQIMEAYQIETSFGRNIEAYIGNLSIDGVDRKVDLLRVGRVLLAYQTPDLAETGYWDTREQQWKKLDGAHRRAISDGLRIARKQAAPSLLLLPLPAAEDVR